MSESTPSLSRVIGRYALYDKIASGGMASVHLGRLLGPVGFARTVAIKRLHPQFAQDPEFVAMFLDEARLVARISHPNVVPTLDVVHLEGELFIVMEYVRGESLVRLVQATVHRGALVPPSMIATVMVGVLHGLHAAHEAKSELGKPLDIVHRDVSPQNILVGVDGVPRVLDFGVAKAVGRLQTTREGQLKGKIGYMAPDQITGQASRATDVYAAAVVLWEALTGQRLFTGDNEAFVLGLILNGTRTPPSEHVPGLSPALDAVVLKGLSVDPADRYTTAREMALALEEAVPLVTASKIGAWVEETARHTLDLRNERIASIESDSALQAPAQAPEITLADVPSRQRASPPATDAPDRARWRVRGVALGGIVLAIAIAGLGFAIRRSSETRAGGEAPPVAPSASAPAPTATTLADLPPPPTNVPEAAGEYAAGMQALHDNSWSLARQHFERTVELDPTLALPHLRVAMTTLVLSSAPVRRREEFAKAAALRAQLTPRDQALLEALEPVLQWVRDNRAAARARLERAIVAYPRDVEFLDWLAFMLGGDPKRSLEPIERAIALDPKDGQAWQTKGMSLALLDRLPEARTAFEGCANLAVDSADCLLTLTRIDAMEGKCDAFESDARHLYDRDPMGAFAVATAMLAKGPASAAADVFDQGITPEPDPVRRAIIRGHFRTLLAAFAGDFARAAELGRRELAAVSSNTTTRSDYGMQLNVTTSLVQALTEMGKDDDARKVASDFLVQSESWSSHSFGFGLDLSLWLARLTSGPPTAEFERRRAAWIDQRLTRSEAYPGLVWTFAYGAPALTPDEAQAALAALPKLAPLTRFWLGSASPDAYAGHVHLLAGKPDDAVPYLRRAVANCSAPVEAVLTVHAALDLGLALEASDRAGACDAFKRVLDRWGHAKPRSVTADRAKERAHALGCSR